MEDKIKNPLDFLDDWEDDLLLRYPEKDLKSKEEYRDYDTSDRAEGVKKFYRLNHQYQTYDFVSKKEKEFLAFDRKKKSLWDAVDFLNTLVDDSDPDIELDQFQHLLQTSESIRADGHEDWFVLTGFIHDLGKVLCLFGEPQWAVVGDTFPVGCKFSNKIVYPEFFYSNPDTKNPTYNTPLGIYSQNCGLDKVKMSWGHDEYLYQILTEFDLFKNSNVVGSFLSIKSEILNAVIGVVSLSSVLPIQLNQSPHIGTGTLISLEKEGIPYTS